MSTADSFFPVEICVLCGLRTAPLKGFPRLRHIRHGVLTVLCPWSGAQPPLPAQETPCRLLATLWPGDLHSGRPGGSLRSLGQRPLFWNTYSCFPLCCLVWRNAFRGDFPRKAAWNVLCLRPYLRMPQSSAGPWPGPWSTARPPPPGEESTPVPLSWPFPCIRLPPSNLRSRFPVGLLRKQRGFVPVEPSSRPASRDAGRNLGTDRVCHHPWSAVPARVPLVLYSDRCPSLCSHSGSTARASCLLRLTSLLATAGPPTSAEFCLFQNVIQLSPSQLGSLTW